MAAHGIVTSFRLFRLFSIATLAMGGALLSSCGIQMNRQISDVIDTNGQGATFISVSSFSINEISPTKNTPIAISAGTITGAYSDYCLLENDVDYGHCPWIAGAVPSAYAPTLADGNLTLSLFLRASDGSISNRANSNTVYVDRVAPALSTATVTNASPSATRNYAMTYGAITGTYTQYCVLANDTVVGNCSWSGGTLPTTYQVPNVDATYTLSVWVRDAAGNVSNRVQTNAVDLDSSVPSLASVTITNGAYTNSTTYNLSYTGISGPYDRYCILENNTSVASCAWTTASLPASFTVSSTQNAKTLSVWIRNTAGTTSTRVDSNSVVLDTTAPVVSLTAPTNAQILTAGASFNVQWTASDTNLGATPVRLEVSSDSGSTWSDIVAATSNAGTYAWTVPSVTSKTYRVRATVTDRAGNSASSANTADFWINGSAPTVAVTYPNGGEVLKENLATSITWASSGLPAGAATAKVEYSTNGGTSWTTVTSSNANTGSQAWTTPALDTTSALVRVTVTDSFGVATSDVSNAAFKLDQTAPTVALNSLDGGQTVAGNSAVPIQWTVTDANFGTTPISLEVSSDGGSTWSALAGPIANSSAYSWTTPTVNSATYRVRVIAVDLAGHSTTAASTSNFTINSSSPVVTVTAPNGGETLPAGAASSITWTVAGLPPGSYTADVDYSLNGGSSWTSLATGLSNATSYSWSIAACGAGLDEETARVRVTVTDALSAQTADASDSNFRIDCTAPVVSLTNLTGGQMIPGNQSYNITWTATDAHLGGTPIKLEYSSNSGSTWTTIDAATANDGTYAWTVPNVTSTTYRVRVTATDLAGRSTASASTSDFVVNNSNPAVAVTSPNGGEFWAGGSARDIAWTATGLPAGASTAKLEYTTDGSTWNTIIASTANASGANTYSWNPLPSVNSTTVKVRVTVTDVLGVATADASDANFAIDSTAPVVAIGAPTTNQILTGGTSFNVAWSTTEANGYSPDMRLVEVSSDGGSTWSTASANASSASPYAWSVPLVTSTTYQVRVTVQDKAGNTGSDTKAFRINSSTPVVDVTSPDGAEVWAGGSSHAITWTATGLPAGSSTAKLEYTTNGSSWTTIAASTANASGANSYTWNPVPSIDSATVKVRVTVTDSFSVATADSSAANFTIDSTAPTLALTQPNGGEVLSGGATYAITWTASDATLGSNPITIEKSSDSGSTWSAVASNVAHTGNPSTYSWTVPSVDSTTYRVRLTATDGAGNTKVVSSAADFQIISTAPALASVTITNANPTNDTTLHLTYGATTGLWDKYCVLLNDTNVANCSFQTGSLPSSIAGGADGTKTVYVWLKGPTNLVSAMQTSNAVTLNTVAPTLASVTVTNASTTGFRHFVLEYGTIGGSTPTSYCMLENDTNVAHCSWTSGSVPAYSYDVATTNGAKVISVWLKDAAGNVSARKDSNSVTYSKTVTIAISPTGNAALGTGSTIVPGMRFIPQSTTLQNGNVLVMGGVTNGNGYSTAQVTAYDPATNTWKSKAPMLNARGNFQAQQLADGRVFVAGGLYWQRGGTYSGLRNAEIYDPTADLWSPRTQFPSNARYRYASVKFTHPVDGTERILYAGGKQDGSTYLSTVYIYNPSNDSWKAAASMSIARADPYIALLPNGKILVGGGQNSGGESKTAEIYDPAANTWTSTNSTSAYHTYAAAMMLTAAESGLAYDTVLVVGGGGASGTYTSVVEQYRIDTGAWSTKGSPAASAVGETPALVKVGTTNVKIYLFGGTQVGAHSNKTAVYDPSAGTWTAKTNLPRARGRHVAALLSTGQILVAGGTEDSLGEYPGLNYLYDITGDSYSKAASFFLRVRNNATFKLNDGRVMSCGGYSDTLADTVPDCFAFDPTTGDWDTLKPMAQKRQRFTLVGTASGDILATGGLTNNTFYGAGAAVTGSNELYSISTGTWATKISLSSPRCHHQAIMSGYGYVMIVGGFDGNSTYYKNAEKIDPYGNTRASGGTMNANRTFHNAIQTPDAQILVMGGYDGTNVRGDGEQWDGGSNTWTSTSANATGHAGAEMFNINDGTSMVYKFISGFSGTGSTTTTEVAVWRRLTDSWSTPGPGLSMPTTYGRYGFGYAYLAEPSAILFGGTQGTSTAGYSGTPVKTVYRYQQSWNQYDQLTDLQMAGNQSDLIKAETLGGSEAVVTSLAGAGSTDMESTELYRFTVPITVTATGGDTAYTFSKTSGVGNFYPKRHVYVPPLNSFTSRGYGGGTAVLHVEDSLTNGSNVTITIP